MDRRMMAPGPQQLMRPNSFIPTSSSSNNQRYNNGKLEPVQVQQLALQSQLQAQYHNHALQVNSTVQFQQYNGYTGQNQHPFGHATLPKSVGMPPTEPAPPLNTRTLQRKYAQPPPYNPPQPPRNYPDPLYGNLGLHPQVSLQPYRHEQPRPKQQYPPSPPVPPQGSQIQPVINQIQQQHHSTKILQEFPTLAGENNGLPQSLVESMRTLFDILDDSKQGRVRFSDIESRWENSESGGKGNTGAEPLIKMGVMGYLRKVTPPDGMLTFDKFCSGLRLALVTNHNATNFEQMTNNTTPVSHFCANNNRSVIQPSHASKPRPTSLPISANHNANQNVPRSMSRIPGFAANQSKFPAASPPKPKISQDNPIFQNGGTARRVVLNQLQPPAEQGTTVVMIHQPPTGTVVPSFSHRPNDIQIGTIRLTKPALVTPPNGGFKYKPISQNGSLDNLKTEEEQALTKTVGKLRPPSAPLLDTTDDDDGAPEQYNRNLTNKRGRARSGDRGSDDAKQSSDSFGKRVVSFVTPRQRTLSMPQLQQKKLSAKAMLDDDSSPSLSSSSHSPLSSGDTKRGALKSSLKSPSAIPTKSVKQTVTLPRNREPSTVMPFKPTSTDDSNDVPAPPKPPRNNPSTVSVNDGTTTPDLLLSGSSTTSTINHPSKPEIRQYLQSWKKGVSNKITVENERDSSIPPPLPEQPPPNPTIEGQDTETMMNGTVKLRGDKKLNLRRRETARRHTVQAGIDFATLKRLKQLEQERDILQQGLGVVDTSREWYRKKMEEVEDKISTLTKGTSTFDQYNDSLEDRLNLLSCRILEINGLLAVLMNDITIKIPCHMNLQIPSHLSIRTITQLKGQNRQLTQEVSDCSHRVTQLETEKAMLLRQLFHQKSSHLQEETVYM